MIEGDVLVNSEDVNDILEIDMRPAEDISLAKMLRNENFKLKTKQTKLAGLSATYNIFSLGAEYRIYESFWYKNYHSKSFQQQRAKIAEEYGCFARFLIRKFKGFPPDLQKAFKFHMDRDDHVGFEEKFPGGISEAFEFKIYKYIFTAIEDRCKGQRYGAVNIFDLEYNFFDHGAFFVDREIILEAIQNYHPFTVKENNDMESKFIIGDGVNGQYGEIGLDFGSGKIPSRVIPDQNAQSADW